MKALLAGTTIAEHPTTVEVEGNHYFPPEAVDWSHLRPVGKRTLCTWKGIATYFDVAVGEHVVEQGAWSYRRPFPWIRRIRDHIAFGDRIEIAE